MNEQFERLKEIAKEQFNCNIIETPPNGECFETLFSVTPTETGPFILNKYPEMWDATSSAIDIVNYIDTYVKTDSATSHFSFAEVWQTLHIKIIDLIKEAKIIENDE